MAPAHGPQPVLELSGICKSFFPPGGRVDVLREVDLEIQSGEFVAITGPSGSGKSTLLNLACLLDTPTAGRLWLEGADISLLDGAALDEIRKRRIGMVFQQFHLLPHRTVLENVLFRYRYLETEAGPARQAAEAALAAVGLLPLAGRAARLLSGGEMQRVAIARAMALPPALLVADEPTGNLDRRSALAVMDCFRRMNENGMTILLVTHNEALLSYCTRHLLCREGRLEEAAHAAGA